MKPEKWLTCIPVIMGLLLLSFVIWSGCGKNSTGSDDSGRKDLALVRFDEVVQTAGSDLPEDAVLVWVSADEVDAEGKSRVWIYVYYSPGEDEYYQYESSENGVSSSDLTVDPAELSGTALPDTIIDSNVAIALSEANGGTTFRNTYSGTTMQLSLLMVDTTGFGSGTAKAAARGGTVDLLPVWECWYIAPDAEAVALVNGHSGEFIQFLLLFEREAVTARDGWNNARKRYAEAANGTLVWIGTNGVPANGINMRWVYAYKTASKLRYIDWDDGMLQEPHDPVGGEVTYSWPAVPSGWLNSDAIMAVAESNGGASYRAAHPSVDVEMYLFPAGKTDTQRPVAVWGVFYGITPMQGLGFEINALTGEMINSQIF
ncbi:hypothetical protein JXO52_02180 [bacterium]|nr:hypothetical protein [bacterium]